MSSKEKKTEKLTKCQQESIQRLEAAKAEILGNAERYKLSQLEKKGLHLAADCVERIINYDTGYYIRKNYNERKNQRLTHRCEVDAITEFLLNDRDSSWNHWRPLGVGRFDAVKEHRYGTWKADFLKKKHSSKWKEQWK